jgi:hypothetical protein
MGGRMARASHEKARRRAGLERDRPAMADQA